MSDIQGPYVQRTGFDDTYKTAAEGIQQPVSHENPLPVYTSGIASAGNTSTATLLASATFTGTADQNSQPQVGVSCFSDTAGTLYFDSSVNGADWRTYPVNGFAVSANIHEFHTAVKLGRYFRVRFVNSASAQSTFQLYTYYGSGFVPTVAPLNQSAGLDSDATLVRAVDFYDEVARGLRSGVSKWNKFGYRSDIDNADGEHVIWESDTPTFTPLTAASTFDIAYDGTAGGSTDGSGTTGATQLTFYYIDSDGKEAIAAHNLGTDGTDTTSFSGFGINRVVVSASGSNDTNVSAITITATTGGSVQATIPAGQGVSQQMIFFVAANRQANAKYLLLNVRKLTGSGGSPRVTFKGYVYNRSIGTRFEVFRLNVDTSVENTIEIQDPFGFTLNATDVLYFVADTDTNNTSVTGRFSLVTYQTL